MEKLGRTTGHTRGRISAVEVDGVKVQYDQAVHTFDDQIAAINGGQMNGWDRVRQCGLEQHYACMTQAHAGAVPTLWSLADAYALSDRTFQTSISASWSGSA